MPFAFPRRFRCRSLLLAWALLAIGHPAHATRLVGVSFADGFVYDVDTETGAATNPRVLSTADSTDLKLFAGIEIRADGTVFVATVQSFAADPSHLFSVPLVDPFPDATSLGAIGAQVGEGDLALDPVSGDLFAVGLTDLVAPFTLLRMDPADPAGVDVVGQLGASDISALAFDASGNLYGLDTAAAPNGTLRAIDPSDGSTLSGVPLSTKLGALAGMDFDPETGTLFVADGGSGGTDSLYTLDPATGALAMVGPLGIAGGLSGLALPEPGTAWSACAAMATLVGVAARRRR